MTLKQRIARWALKSAGSDKMLAEFALKSAASDRMTAEELVTAVFGPATSGVRMGSEEILKAYSTMPWLRAVVQRISWNTACVPWQLFVATGEPQQRAKRAGRKAKAVRRSDIAYSTDPDYRIKAYKSLRRSDSLREIEDHPALTLLDSGNERFSGHVTRQVTQQHLDLIGEGAWLIERNGAAMPHSLYPIPPTWIAQTPWDRMNGIHDVLGGVEPGNWVIYSNRGSLVVPKEDVIYFYHPNPADPYSRGRGLGHALGDELETDEATAKHLKRWFKNFAIPPIIIAKKNSVMPGMVAAGSGPDVTARLEESWMKKLMGRNNVPYFSTHELDVHELNDTFKDMELSQLRKDERDIIIHTFGVPPEIFGILENANRSTIDVADYFLGKYVIVPRLEFMRSVLQKQLIELYDPRLIIDYVSPIVEDKEFELKTMQAAPYAFTVDEIRELANRKPLEGEAGKGFMVPMSSSYVEDLRETAAEEPAEQPVEEQPAPGAPGEEL